MKAESFSKLVQTQVTISGLPGEFQSVPCCAKCVGKAAPEVFANSILIVWRTPAAFQELVEGTTCVQQCPFLPTWDLGIWRK